MPVLIRNRVLSAALRGIMLVPFVAWAVLFAGGWWQTRDNRPIIEGRTLHEWDQSLSSDGSLMEDANSPGRSRAIQVLQRNAEAVVTEAARRALRKESLMEGVYFATMRIFQRQDFSDGNHQPAHGYRGQAARLLGAVGPRDPRVIPILCELLKNTDFYDYERGEAAVSLNRFGAAAKPALPTMLQVLTSPDNGEGGRFDRSMLIQAIALTGAKEAIPVLETLRNDPENQERIAWAIEHLRKNAEP